MKKHEAYQGKGINKDALKKRDGSLGVLVLTIAGIETVEYDDGDKRTLSFEEDDRQFSLNLTNWELIEEFTGKDDDEDWIGEKIEIYWDPKVKFGKETKGGLRVRRPSSDRGSSRGGWAPSSQPSTMSKTDAPPPPDDAPAAPDAPDAPKSANPELEAIKDKAGAWGFFHKNMSKQGKTRDEIREAWIKVCNNVGKGKGESAFTAADWYAVAEVADIPF